jgi:hypothetical protein
LVPPFDQENVPPPGTAVAQNVFVKPAHVSHPLPGLIELTPTTYTVNVPTVAGGVFELHRQSPSSISTTPFTLSVKGYVPGLGNELGGVGSHQLVFSVYQ